MDHDHVLNATEVLQPTYVPETVYNRKNEQQAIAETLSERGTRNLYIYGPLGSGKTLLARTALNELPQDIATCYVSCINAETQYKVLQQIYLGLTGHEPANGYHTAELQRSIERQIRNQETVVVLDDIEFLLENNGDDLLYYLSRMESSSNLAIIAISSNYPDPSTVVEERTYSSLRPHCLTIEPYTASEAQHILENRLRNASLAQSIDDDALTTIVTATKNIRLALYWLQFAAAAADDHITADLLNDVRYAAVQRYRDTRLKDFTAHHQMLLEAISQLVTEQDSAANTGPVYERYTDLCRSTGKEPLSHRRICDFLTHLELLQIIKVNHHAGGKHGRTREIRLHDPL